MTKKKNSLITPPRHLSDKVPSTGGPIPEDAIRKALNLGNELSQSYKGWAIDDLQALWEEYKTLTEQPKLAPSCITKMYDMGHEIRGQGGTFGYPLITLIGDSLCKYLEGRRKLGNKGQNIVQLHLLAMKAVLRQDMKGSQETFEHDLKALLVLLCAR